MTASVPYLGSYPASSVPDLSSSSWQYSDVYSNHPNLNFPAQVPTTPQGKPYITTGSLASTLVCARIPVDGGVAALTPTAGPIASGAYYVLTQLPSCILSGRLQFRFRAAGTTQGSSVACGIFNTSAPVLGAGSGLYAPFHLAINQASWQLSKILNGVFTAMQPVNANNAAPLHSRPLILDGLTCYTIEFRINPTTQTAVLIAADGQRYYFSDPVFARTDGVWFFQEATSAATTDQLGEPMAGYADSRILPFAA